ncbi:phytanoyl-CoA dioxygenase family protein [Alphaproteobacteria bacterium]|nr:phytanoyl-CoA dioxygenase family protein [Alphaproteobacteria bacterium]
MLSADEIETYHAEGLTIPSAFSLPSEVVEVLRDAVDKVVTLNPYTPSDHLINVHLDRAPPFDLHGDPVFGALVTAPAILDMVKQLIGSDIILWTTHLFCKQAGTGREVPWHQDGHYWPIRPLATCTAWVALDDTNRDNGALRYIPGSHKMGTFEHHPDMDPQLTLHQVVDNTNFDPATKKYVEMKAGQLSLHDVHILHGSTANTSGAESLAWVAIFAFAPISAVYYPVETLPEWLQIVAWCTPSAYVFEGMRSVFIDDVFRTDLLLGAIGVNLVYLAIGAGLFAWSFTAAREHGRLLQIGE